MIVHLSLKEVELTSIRGTMYHCTFFLFMKGRLNPFLPPKMRDNVGGRGVLCARRNSSCWNPTKGFPSIFIFSYFFFLPPGSSCSFCPRSRPLTNGPFSFCVYHGANTSTSRKRQATVDSSFSMASQKWIRTKIYVQVRLDTYSIATKMDKRAMQVTCSFEKDIYIFVISESTVERVLLFCPILLVSALNKWLSYRKRDIFF